MIKFVLRRIVLGVMIMLGSSVLIYALILAAPGGPEQKFAENPKYTAEQKDRKSTRLNSSHSQQSRMPSSA